MILATSKIEKLSLSLLVISGGATANFTFELGSLFLTTEFTSNWSQLSGTGQFGNVSFAYQLPDKEEKFLFQNDENLDYSSDAGEGFICKNVVEYGPNDGLTLNIAPISLKLNMSTITLLQSACDAFFSSFPVAMHAAHSSNDLKWAVSLQKVDIALALFGDAESLMFSIVDIEFACPEGNFLELSLYSICSSFQNSANGLHTIPLLEISNFSGKFMDHIADVYISRIALGLYDYPVWLLRKSFAYFESSSSEPVNFSLVLNVDQFKGELFYSSKCTESPWNVFEGGNRASTLCFSFDKLCELEASSVIVNLSTTSKEYLKITFNELFELTPLRNELLFIEAKQPPEAFKNYFTPCYIPNPDNVENSSFFRFVRKSSPMEVIFKQSDMYSLFLQAFVVDIDSSFCPEFIVNFHAYFSRLFVFNLFAPVPCSSFFCFPVNPQRNSKFRMLLSVKNSCCKLFHVPSAYQRLFIEQGDVTIDYEREIDSILSKKNIEVVLNTNSCVKNASDETLFSWGKPLHVQYVSPKSVHSTKSYVQELAIWCANIFLYLSETDLRDLVLFKEKILHFLDIFFFQIDCYLDLPSPCHTMTSSLTLTLADENELVLPSTVFENSYPFEFSICPYNGISVIFSTFQFKSSSNLSTVEILSEEPSCSSLKVNINDIKGMDESFISRPFTIDILLNNAKSTIDIYECLSFRFHGAKAKSITFLLCFLMEFVQSIPLILEGVPCKKATEFVLLFNAKKIVAEIGAANCESISLSMLNCLAQAFSSGGNKMDIFYFFAGYSLKYKNYCISDEDVIVPSLIDKSLLVFDPCILANLVDGNTQIYCPKALSLYTASPFRGQFSSEKTSTNEGSSFCMESVQKLNFFVPFVCKIYDASVLHQAFNFIFSSIPKKDLEAIIDPKSSLLVSTRLSSIDDITLCSQVSVGFLQGIYIFLPFDFDAGSFYLFCTHMRFASNAKFFATPNEEKEYFRWNVAVSNLCFSVDPSIIISDGGGALISDSYLFPSLPKDSNRQIVTPVYLNVSLDGKRKHPSLSEIWSKIEVSKVCVNITSNDILLLWNLSSTLCAKIKTGNWMIPSRGSVPPIELVNQISLAIAGVEILVIFEDYAFTGEKEMQLSCAKSAHKSTPPSLSYSCPFLKVVIPKLALEDAYFKVENIRFSEDEEEEPEPFDPDLNVEDDSNSIRFDDDANSSYSEFFSDISDELCNLFVVFTMEVKVDYFNSDNSTWEPLIETWQFTATIDRKWLRALNMTTSTEVTISSMHNLEFCVSQVFLKYAALYLRRIFSLCKDLDSVATNSKGQSACSAHGQNLTFLVRNETGVDLMLWSSDGVTPTDSTSGETTPTAVETTEICDRLQSGESLYWRFSSSRDPILNVHLLEDRFPFESIRNIPVNKYLSSLFLLRPSMDGIKHFIVAEVSSYNLASAARMAGQPATSAAWPSKFSASSTLPVSSLGSTFDPHCASFALHDPITYAKRIDISSALQLQNHTDIVFEVMFFIPDRLFQSRELASFLIPQIYVLECWPGEVQGVPLDIAYYSRFKIRPKYFVAKENTENLPNFSTHARNSKKSSPINSVRYIWSASSVDWRTVLDGTKAEKNSTFLSANDVELISNPDLSFVSEGETSGLSQVFSVSTIVHCERLGDFSMHYPAMRCHFLPPVIISSQLPYPITFKILDRRQKVNFKASLASYETLHLHYVALSASEDIDGGPALLGLMVDIPDIGCTSRNPSLIYHSAEASRRLVRASKQTPEQRTKVENRAKTEPEQQNPYVDDFIELVNGNGLPLVLRINYR